MINWEEKCPQKRKTTVATANKNIHGNNHDIVHSESHHRMSKFELLNYRVAFKLVRKKN